MSMSSQDKNAITNNKQEDSSSKDNTQLIFRINMIAYVVLMVIFTEFLLYMLLFQAFLCGLQARCTIIGMR